MTDLDELLARLRKLEPIALEEPFRHQVQERARLRVRRATRPAPLASLALFTTVIVYLSWALQFSSSLYP